MCAKQEIDCLNFTYQYKPLTAAAHSCCQDKLFAFEFFSYTTLEKIEEMYLMYSRHRESNITVLLNIRTYIEDNRIMISI